MVSTLVEPRTEAPAKRSFLRADIQALRALAVGLVLLNHLWPGDVPGGYIGVDIFFVISGFLITSHLRREVDTTGSVKLARFWARRAKRLLPAAILVLIASALITAWVLPVTSAQAAYAEIGAAGAYFLNWLLAANSLDYFAQGALSPVTHYWSLSAEEQFYIVWPLLILLGLLFSRSRGARVRYWTMVGTLGLVFVGSLAWAVWSVSTEPNAAYFQTTGRAWEFAAGGLLAFLPSKQWRSSHSKAWVSWALWAAVLGCALIYGPQTGFPGLPALVPVVATAALIWIGDGGFRLSPQRVLGIPPIRFIGDISYSLYLWHWPLIVAATALIGDLSGVVKVGILATSVLLAWLTKRYVEDTIRFAKGPVLGNPVRVLVATVATIALILGGTNAAAASIDNRAVAAANELHQQALDPSDCFGAQAGFNDGCNDSHRLESVDSVLIGWGSPNNTVSNGRWCQQLVGVSEVMKCSYGVPKGEQKLNVALVGDSHATIWAPALDSIAEEYGLRITTYLAAGCSAIDDPAIGMVFDTNPQHVQACADWRKTVSSEIEQSTSIDIIVTTGFQRAYARIDDPAVKDSGDGYAKAWNRWLAAGKTVIALNDVPLFPESIPTCLATTRTAVDPCSMTVDPASQFGPLAAAADKIDNPKFTYVDHWGVFCEADTCSAVVGGIPAYVDSSHLTLPFSRSFGRKLIPAELLGGRAQVASVQ